MEEAGERGRYSVEWVNLIYRLIVYLHTVQGDWLERNKSVLTTLVHMTISIINSKHESICQGIWYVQVEVENKDFYQQMMATSTLSSEMRIYNLLWRAIRIWRLISLEDGSCKMLNGLFVEDLIFGQESFGIGYFKKLLVEMICIRGCNSLETT